MAFTGSPPARDVMTWMDRIGRIGAGRRKGSEDYPRELGQSGGVGALRDGDLG